MERWGESDRRLVRPQGSLPCGSGTADPIAPPPQDRFNSCVSSDYGLVPHVDSRSLYECRSTV